MSENVLAFVVTAIIIAIGAIILVGFQDNINNTSEAYTIVEHGLSGVSTFGAWLPLIAVIIAAIVILGFVMTFIVPRMQNRGSGA